MASAPGVQLTPVRHSAAPRSRFRFRSRSRALSCTARLQVLVFLLFVVLGSFVPASRLSADPATLPPQLASLSAVQRAELLRDGVLMRHVSRAADLQLQPRHPFRSQVEEALASAGPNIITETVMLLPFGISDNEYLALYNSLRRVSDLADIEYWNEEKERHHDLFTTSFHVASRDDPRPRPDPLVRAIPPFESIHILQDIPPFHEVISRYDYHSRTLPGAEAFLFSGVNLDRIRYRGFPAVGRENMVTLLMVLRGSDHLIVYGVGGARVTNPLGLLSGRIEGPFRYRTMGLFQWYHDSHIRPLRDSRG